MNFRDRVLSERSTTVKEAANDNLLPSIKSDCFGIERSRYLPACIDFRLANGDNYALPYSLISCLSYDKSVGIEIVTSVNTVQIKGYNLEQLYDYLVMFRVRYVQHSKDSTASKKAQISDIHINENRS